MIKQRDLANIDTLSAQDLDEFCLYWNSGPGRDAEKDKAKALKLGSEPDYPRGLYKCCVTVKPRAFRNNLLYGILEKAQKTSINVFK